MIKSLSKGQKAALIVNECQLGLLDKRYAMFPQTAEQAEKRNLVPNIAALLKVFRAKGLPVLHTPAMMHPSLKDVKVNSMIAALSIKHPTMTVGRPEVGFPPGLEPQPDDYVIQRSGSNLIAFHGTTLDLTLRRMGVETVILTGISTNIAIPGLTMAAVENGYHVVIPEDCIAGSSEEAHRVIVNEQLRMLATITTKDEVIAALGG